MPIKNPITGSTNMKSLMKEKKRNHDIWLLNPQLIGEWWWTNQIVHKVGQKFGLLNEQFKPLTKEPTFTNLFPFVIQLLNLWAFHQSQTPIHPLQQNVFLDTKLSEEIFFCH